MLCCWLLGACALTSKSEPWTTRYFTPESGAASATQGDETPEPRAAQPHPLRLGRIAASAHLRQPIAFRTGNSELGFYEDRRWTERPEVYLRRALEHALFEQRRAQRVVSGAAPTLEVELTAFEELRGKPQRARMTAIVSLHDQRVGQLTRTITIEQPVAAAGDDPQAAAALVDALAECLQQGVTRISELVLAALERPSASGAQDQAAAR